MKYFRVYIVLLFQFAFGCASKKNLVEEEINSKFIITSKFIAIDKHKIHYIDQGKGDPILLIHGNPTNVYLWKNIIPILSQKNRVIALDLVGHGKSTREYEQNLFYINRKMIKNFISKLNLKNLVIVGHDWGGALAYDYASRNLELKALVLIEPVRPKQSLDSFLGRMLWKTSVLEWYMVKQNYFVETMIPNLTARTLTEQEMANYRAPIKSRNDRRTTYKWWTLLPIQSEQAELYPILERSLSAVGKSKLQKLFIVANPGVIITKQVEARYKKSFKNTTFKNIGDGKHFLQESHPRKISDEILKWLAALNPGL